MAARRSTVFVVEAQGKAVLPVIESMVRAGVRVAAGSEKRYNCGFYARGCRERHLYPSPRTSSGCFKEWLLRFLRRRRIDVLIPNGHYGAVAISEIQEIFSA